MDLRRPNHSCEDLGHPDPYEQWLQQSSPWSALDLVITCSRGRSKGPHLVQVPVMS
ncbi:hypothetical protein I79_000955 [Cricetulus griseus]|uniref:Uncharacterized protein n=1 Tax=Cricetulus griseus TaxID=10029 RepID=G3GTH1_CRIGR|nr:hypothetical protein I79_000955 [Cricetulus griseus]